MRTALIVSLGLIALTGSVQAQDGGRSSTPGRSGAAGQQQSVEQRYKSFDTNKDGKVSKAEYVAAPQPGGNAPQGAASGGDRAQRFDAMDKNKDGLLSLDEYKASRAAAGAGGANRGSASRGSRT